MKFWILFFFTYVLLLAPAICAQGAQPPAPEEQNETMLDTLKRMQIKREEQEHKKILDKGAQIKLDAENLAKDAVGNKLPASADKKLREIEKSAKQIRSEFGGNGNQDEPLKALPGNLDDALKRLNDVAERLNKELGKTSRRVISLSVIETASEITQLVKHIRGYLF
jgi:hypothetical protein